MSDGHARPPPPRDETVYCSSVRAEIAYDWEAWITLGLSVTAFIIAVLAVYLESVKRADIWLALVPDQPPSLVISTASAQEGRTWPAGVSIRIPVVAANSGARGGVLTEVSLRQLEEHESDPTLFAGYGPMPRRLLHGMREIDSGSVRQDQFDIELPFAMAVSANPSTNRASLERALKQKDRLDITLGYTYLKGRSLVPLRRHNALDVHRELQFSIALTPLHAVVRDGT